MHYTIMEKSQETAKFFFRQHGYDGYLSNFYPVKFTIENREFVSSEQTFMYYKCLVFDRDNKELLSNILQESNPNKIKKMGRQVRNFDEKTWNEVKYNIMVRCIREKFLQNEDIKKKLIETYPKHLYEASKWDKIWGIGYDKETAIRTNPNNYGQNLLGKALMKIRDEFIKN